MTTAIETRNDRDERTARSVRGLAIGLVGAAVALPLLPNIPHADLACPLHAATGIPCPFCGMTRACVAAAHGHLASSLAFNPAGVLVVAAAIIAIVRPRLLTRIHLRGRVVAVAIGALWLWNIGFNPTFHQLIWR